MTNVYEASKPIDETTPTAPKSNCGCWIGGCLAVVLTGIVVAGVMFYFLVRFTSDQIEKYTDDAPQELPVIEYDEEALTALETRFEDFKKDLAENNDTEDLVLTADDINAMISSEEKLKGKMFVEIEDGQIKGDISLPLDKLPLGVGKGRYFNASASFKVAVSNGILIVTVDEATVKGEPVPEQFMESLRNENLVKDVKFEGDEAKALRRVQEIVVENGKVVLKVKPAVKKPGEEQAETPDATDEPKPDTTSGDTPVEPESTPPAATLPASDDLPAATPPATDPLGESTAR